MNRSSAIGHSTSDPYILMLVHHEPDLDPRIQWVTSLCTPVAYTKIIGCVQNYSAGKPPHDEQDQCSVERVLITYGRPSLAWLRRLLDHRIVLLLVEMALVLRRAFLQPLYQRLILTAWGRQVVIPVLKLFDQEYRLERSLRAIWAGDPRLEARMREIVEHYRLSGTNQHEQNGIDTETGQTTRFTLARLFDSFHHVMNRLIALEVLPQALYAHAPLETPSLIVCHDIYGLVAGADLKKRYGVPLIYDSHEYWPEADLEGDKFVRWYYRRVEQRFIRQADQVITVSPPLARLLERTYGLQGVISSPNAEPRSQPHIETSFNRGNTYPLKFLLQGGISLGRGIDELLELWGCVNDERAVLILRAPDNSYYAFLRDKYRHLIESNRVQIASAVTEAELVSAASQADVGVIPYIGPNLNHIYACPNKTSQYMQAGLAILNCSDTQFVSEVVMRYDCGMTYDIHQPESMIKVVSFLVEHPDRLAAMKRNGYAAAQGEFNWEVQSKDYSSAIQQHFNQSSH